MRRLKRKITSEEDLFVGIDTGWDYKIESG
jgi:hypothetical protein